MKQIIVNRNSLSCDEIDKLSEYGETVIDGNVIKVMINEEDENIIKSSYNVLDEMNEEE